MIKKFFSTTDECIDFLRGFDLNQLEKVAAEKEQGFSIVKFYFQKQSIEITGAFNIGYSGKGLEEFFNLLVDAGFKKETSEIVLIPEITGFIISRCD